MSAEAPRRRRFWGWGWEDAGPPPGTLDAAVARLQAAFGPLPDPIPPPRPDDLRLPPPRRAVPAALAGLASTDPPDRAGHHYGKAYRDVMRGLRNRFPSPPDAVIRPADEADVARVLDWAATDGVAVVPYGGGSSVVGGVETVAAGDRRGVVSLDLGRLDAVLDVDAASLLARIQGGALGPGIERQLEAHGLTLRHFPQSFEFSSLGGWIATRSAGHYATRHTRIDDFVTAVRAVTPTGTMEAPRFPSSGAGPDLNRLLLGSEGTLGVITEAWMRVRRRSRFRAGTALAFPGGFLAGAAAVRTLAQSGLDPANCRLLDPVEALLASAGGDGAAVLVLGFESSDHPVDAALGLALEVGRDAGGEPLPGREAADRWRAAFFGAPYLRDELAARAVVVETFESAVTWDRFASFHDAVVTATLAAARRICGAGLVASRITHAYPDGAAPYYTVIAPGRPGSEVAQWDEIKVAAAEAVVTAGGTITHHHAVGRDHRPWVDRERPAAFQRVLRAAKAELDPTGILNPGVLLGPVPTT